MINIVICDEEKSIVSSVREVVDSTLSQIDSSYTVLEYTDSRSLVSDAREGAHVDIAILDIEMPYFDGRQTAIEIKKACPDCYIIFLTAHEKYAVEAYELQIFRYALKESYREKLPKYIKDAFAMLNIQAGEVLTVTGGNTVEMIPYRNILYIKKENKYSVVYCTDGHRFAWRKPIGNVKEVLNLGEFVVVDRSCLLNITQIKCISGREIICVYGERFTVSRSNLKEAKEKIIRYFGSII